jgi:3-oxoacyl-[acyl-carrier protein] reductase
MDLELGGRRALITGGSRGIGQGIARGLVAEGADVALCARDPAGLDAALEELRAAGASTALDERRAAGTSTALEERRAAGTSTALGIIADVSDPGQLAWAVGHAAEGLGGLDLLVANAGGAFGGGLLDSTPEEWAATFALNVLHAAQVIRAAVPHLAGSDAASVVIVSSISGNRAGSRASYATAKAAETQLAVSLAQELAEQGIRVNAVSPGSTLFAGGSWAQFQAEHPEEFAAFAHDEFPAHRLVELREVADAVCFLLSPRGSGINGAEIVVDGGQNRPGPSRYWPRLADRHG